jgi:hypothetical protein
MPYLPRKRHPGALRRHGARCRSSEHASTARLKQGAELGRVGCLRRVESGLEGISFRRPNTKLAFITQLWGERSTISSSTRTLLEIARISILRAPMDASRDPRLFNTNIFVCPFRPDATSIRSKAGRQAAKIGRNRCPRPPQSALQSASLLRAQPYFQCVTGWDAPDSCR